MRIYTPFILISLILIADSSVYQKYYDEALTIAKAMTIEEKVGQAIQVDFGAFQNDTGFYPEIAAEYYLGSLLVGGNGAPN